MSGEKTLEFRYTKKEQFLGIGWLIAFLFFIGLGACIPFIVKRQTPGDIYAMVTWFSICFIGIFYSINLWLRRRSFSIKADNDGFVISKLGKSQRIHWKDIKSYVYQYGHHFWFISLYLANDKHINLHGELEDFNELVSAIRENVQCRLEEFQYTMRKKESVSIYSVLILFNTVTIVPLLILGFIGRAAWNVVLYAILLMLTLTLWNIFSVLRKTQDKFFADQEGITMKQWLRKPIFISWSEIANESQIMYTHVQLGLIRHLFRAVIKTKNKSISFYEDIDNIDQLLDVIHNKTGIELNL